MRFHLKKLFATSEFISNDISVEKKKNLTAKIKLFTTSEF